MFSEDGPIGLHAAHSEPIVLSALPTDEPAFTKLVDAYALARRAQSAGRHTLSVLVEPRHGGNYRRLQEPFPGCQGYVWRVERRNRGTIDKPQVSILGLHVLLEVIDVLEAYRESLERANSPVPVVKVRTRFVSPRFKQR